MSNRLFYFVVSGFIMFLIFSCGSGKNDKQSAAPDTITSAASKDTGKIVALTQFKYDKLIGNIPIPFDILRTHAEVPLTYNPSVLNPVSSLPFYSSNASKALNLGIYGADLAYNITYEKFEDMGSYLKCAKKLADDLGIPLAFDQRALAAYKKFGTNKDSLEKTVFASYSEVDKTLKSNERIGLASLVIAGSWLEGLYTTLKTLGSIPRTDKSKVLYIKIREQKNHLDMILNLLGQFKEDPAFASVVQEFNNIKSVYDGFSVKSEISETEIVSLSQKVETIRNKIVALRPAQ